MVRRLKRGVVAPLNALGTLLLSPPYGGFGYYRNHGPRTKRKVAITFDDGPSRPCTEALLDAMGQLNVRGTFFCVGTNVGMHPDLILRAYHAGHDIANHSWEHRRAAGLRLGNNAEHIDWGAEAIQAVIGRMPRLYRPPWGWMTPWEGQRLTQRGYTIIGWDVYTLDWKWPEVDGHVMADKARTETQPGSILLWHDGTPGVREWPKQETVRAIKQIVPALQAEGYEFVPVSELLGVAAYGQATQATQGAQAST